MKTQNTQPASYHVIGLMSGSSLDGLDIVYAIITSADQFAFRILAADTFTFNEQIKNDLAGIDASKNDFHEEDIYFATVSVNAVNGFIQKHQISKIDFIASHGHTIFHNPQNRTTRQIGDGKTIAEKTKNHVINNFRQKDIDAGGQGAPLVPICDELFFSDYQACLNIGGISNISYKINGNRIGFDICGANQLLNNCAEELNLRYDENGELASRGKVDEFLLSSLNASNYFNKSFPKSLDNHFVKKEFVQLLMNSKISSIDKLATATEHAAFQISNVIKRQLEIEQIENSSYRLLVTGGGAYNQYLIKRIELLSDIQIQLPEKMIIEFKEALAMCLMGVLRWEQKPNFLISVTGASHAVSGGDIHLHS